VGEHDEPAAGAVATGTSTDLVFASATEQAARVRAGDISALELVEAALETIERLDPELNAFVALCPERALAEADAFAPETRGRSRECRLG
jgi:Asp-tRNA(Asn)/Glu-tRNA(Gln) amidotransferase A subunit family amidase